MIKKLLAPSLLAALFACEAPPEETPPVREESPLRVEISPKQSRVPVNGQLVMSAQVFNDDGEMVFNRNDLPIVINWFTSDPSTARVDELGIVTILKDGPVTITAEVDGGSVTMYSANRHRRPDDDGDSDSDSDNRVNDLGFGDPETTEPTDPTDPGTDPGTDPEPTEPVEVDPNVDPEPTLDPAPAPAPEELPFELPSDDATLNPEGDNAPFTDVHAIFVSPTRIAIDLNRPLRLDVTAIDAQGAPTSLDCTPTITGGGDTVTTQYDGRVGAEGINVTGKLKGFAVLQMECDGFHANPIVVEVKPSVTIPDPSPSAFNSDFGWEPSLALNGEEIHLTTYDASFGKLVYTHFDGVWSSQFIDGEGDYGRHSEVVLDPLNNKRPLICAIEGEMLTCWLVDGEGYWGRSVVDQVVAGESYETPVSSAVTSDGRVILLYHRQADDALVLATSHTATRDEWSHEVVTYGADHASMALASDDSVRIAFRQDNAARYAHQGCVGAGPWSIEDIDAQDVAIEDGDDATAPGTFIRLALGLDDRPQVVYYKGGNLVHAIKTVGSWRSNVVEAVKLGGPSIGFALDHRFQPRISYYDEDARRMRYASRRDRSWHIDSPTGAQGIGTESVLAVDSFNRAQIAYYNDTTNEAGFYVEPHFLEYTPFEEAAPDLASSFTNLCSGY